MSEQKLKKEIKKMKAIVDNNNMLRAIEKEKKQIMEKLEYMYSFLYRDNDPYYRNYETSIIHEIDRYFSDFEEWIKKGEHKNFSVKCEGELKKDSIKIMENLKEVKRILSLYKNPLQMINMVRME